MKTPLAWLNLLHNKVRTFVALSGVAFAVVLIFMQWGFLGAVQTTGTLIYSAIDFDLLLRNKEYIHLMETRTIPRSRLDLTAGIRGVDSVHSFYVAINQWRNPVNGQPRGVLIMAVNPLDPVFKLDELQSQASKLVSPGFVLIDRKSRIEFGPANGRQFGDQDIGVQTDVAGFPVRIVGHFSLGWGFAGDGGILLSDAGFARAIPGRTLDDVSLGLVKLTKGADPDEVAARIRAVLPDDTEVLTRHEAIDFEARRWLHDTTLGIIFQLGVAISLIVGMAIVYQVLSSDVASRMAEYATLKAMGYRDRYLAGVVLQQAVMLAVVGFALGTAFSTVMYAMITYVANIPVTMTAGRIVCVFGLAVTMCVISGLAAMRKIRSADPAELY